MARMAMLIDLTRCIGCDACTVACKQENGTPVDVFFARVLNIESGAYPNVKRVYLPVLCNHCDDAPCLKACPNKAIIRRPDGIVLIDQNRCRGTGACVSACPYGNVVLQSEDKWYLNEDEPYEKDFVKPRIRPGKARKCTYCAHRVDEGLDPACVVACPTTARIFGDLEDPESDVSKYIREQEEKTRRRVFHLLPQANTKPAGCYLGPMAEQISSVSSNGLTEENSETQEEPAPPTAEEKQPALTRFAKLFGRSSASILLLLLMTAGIASIDIGREIFEDSSCAACHGDAGEGGYASAITGTKLTLEEFMRIVRDGVDTMPPTDDDEMSDDDVRLVYEFLAQGKAAARSAKTPTEAVSGLDVYSGSTCVGCHGVTGMGGMGPPVLGTTLSLEEFRRITRDGKGRMPPTPESVLSEEDLEAMYHELSTAEKDLSAVPLAFQIGQFMSTRNVGIIFSVATLIALLLWIKVIAYWLSCSGLKELLPHLGKVGYFKSFGILISSLFLDGFLVRSLWKANKHRWFVHGLMLYGFTGLILADILIQIFNPTRAAMAMSNPLKMLPIVSGLAVFLGVMYVMYRYRSDKYIDNGLTLGRDFFFLNVLFHTVFSGFLTMVINKSGASEWAMPIYMYHLAAVLVLFVSAPYTRFAHAVIVPMLIAVTRLTEAVTSAGVELGFEREPSPGRHHKSERLSRDLMEQIGEDNNIRLRYYP